MTYIARLSMPKSAAIKLLDAMPKERGSDFLAGVIAGGVVNRTYTRVDGDRFQISRTAGMGSSVVCSGEISDQHGQSVVMLRTTYGMLPLQGWPALSLLALIGAVLFYMVFGRDLAALAWGSAGVSVLSSGLWWFKLWDANFLRNELSKHLNGARWVRTGHWISE